MTRNQFLILCLEHGISPELALENANIVQALREKDDAEIKRLMLSQF